MTRIASLYKFFTKAHNKRRCIRHNMYNTKYTFIQFIHGLFQPRFCETDYTFILLIYGFVYLQPTSPEQATTWPPTSFSLLEFLCGPYNGLLLRTFGISFV
jgi:hypothetical protein